MIEIKSFKAMMENFLFDMTLGQVHCLTLSTANLAIPKSTSTAASNIGLVLERKNYVLHGSKSLNKILLCFSQF